MNRLNKKQGLIKKVIIIGILTILILCLGKLGFDFVTLHFIINNVPEVDTVFLRKKEELMTSTFTETGLTEVRALVIDETERNEGEDTSRSYGVRVYSTEITQKGNFVSETFLVSLEDSEMIDEIHPEIDAILKSKIFMTLHYYVLPLGNKMKLVAITTRWQPISEKIMKINGHIIYTEMTSKGSFIGEDNTNKNKKKENGLVIKTGFIHYGERIDSNLKLSFSVNKEDKFSNEIGDFGTGLFFHFSVVKSTNAWVEKWRDKNGNITNHISLKNLEKY